MTAHKPTKMDHGRQKEPSAKVISNDDLTLAANALHRGKLVAFPTETVYGLGADATNDLAVAAIFDAKGRPRFNPLIVHIADQTEADKLAIWGPLAGKLAAHFWPGPLTLIAPRRADSGLSMLVSAGSDTVALRIPDHPIARDLLSKAGRPIAAPSANPAGRISPTNASHVIQGLGDRIDMVIDGGACLVGVESTVIDVTQSPPRLLRPGGLSREAIEAVIGERLLSHDEAMSNDDSPLRSPGQLSSHYAPKHSVRLDALSVRPDEGLLAFGPNPVEGAACSFNLSPSGDLREAAGHLFAMLHDLDRQDIAGIAVMTIPANGLGEAIVDRLKRAAAEV